MPTVVAMSEIPANKVNQPGKNRARQSRCAEHHVSSGPRKDTPDAPTAALNRYEGANAFQCPFSRGRPVPDHHGRLGRIRPAPCRAVLRPFLARLHALRSAAVGQGHGMGFHRAALALRSRRAALSLGAGEIEADPQPPAVAGHDESRFSAADGGVSVEDVPEIKDDAGLFTQTITMAPEHAHEDARSLGGDGQYVVVVKGSLIHEGKERAGAGGRVHQPR